MKVVYIISPYRHNGGIYYIMRNIQKAERIAVILWEMGYAVICPHKNSALLDGIVKDDAFLKGDIEILRRCDVAVVSDDWAESVGCKAEVKFCDDNNIPVFTVEELLNGGFEIKSRWSDD